MTDDESSLLEISSQYYKTMESNPLGFSHDIISKLETAR